MRLAKTLRLSWGAAIWLSDTRNASCSRAVRYTVDPTLIVTATSMPMNTLERSFHSSNSRLDTSRALVSLRISYSGTTAFRMLRKTPDKRAQKRPIRV